MIYSTSSRRYVKVSHKPTGKSVTVSYGSSFVKMVKLGKRFMRSMLRYPKYTGKTEIVRSYYDVDNLDQFLINKNHDFHKKRLSENE